MTDYKLFKQMITQDGKDYDSYGIEYCEDGETKYIPDISTDREAASDFVNRLNCGDASSIHIYELVEDFLN